MSAYDNPLASLTVDDVHHALEHLANGYGRSVPPMATVEVWLGELREANVQPGELKPAVTRVLRTKERFPSISVFLEALLAVKSEAFTERQEAELAERKRWEAEDPERYEQWRQEFKRANNIGVETPEKVHRYGHEIAPSKYTPPHLRELLTEEPDDDNRGGGPRRLL